MKKKGIVKEYKYRGRSFTIIKKDGFYLAIEDKYITDGKMNTSLNGLQMKASEKLGQCIDAVKKSCDIEYYETQGMSKAEAFAKAFDLPIEMAELLF